MKTCQGPCLEYCMYQNAIYYLALGTLITIIVFKLIYRSEKSNI